MDVRVCVRGACPFEIDKDDGAISTSAETIPIPDNRRLNIESCFLTQNHQVINYFNKELIYKPTQRDQALVSTLHCTLPSPVRRYTIGQNSAG